MRLCTAISHDSLLIATAGNDGSARVWDAITGNQRYALLGHSGGVMSGGVMSGAFRPDGKQPASGGQDGTIRLWNLVSGEVESILPEAQATKLIANWEQTQDAETGTTTFSASGEIAWIIKVLYTADGQWVAAGGVDGSLAMYATSVEALRAMAEERLERDFTCQERVQYLGEEVLCE